MKRIILLAVLSLALMVWLSSVNCSDPLESSLDGADSMIIFRTDTVTDTCVDTLTDTVTDTLTDTLVDTLTDTITDTVYIPEGEVFTICSIIHYNLNELIWTFNNAAGTYDLLFTVTVEREFSFHELIFTIDDDEYSLFPAQSLELNIQDIDLPENVTIRIKPDVPLLLGHQVDVCLAIYELKY